MARAPVRAGTGAQDTKPLRNRGLMAVSIGLVIILGLLADLVFRRLRLPGFIGMLLVGILVGPHGLNLMAPDMISVSADFRKIALVVILLRAGFGLNRSTLRRVGKVAVTMSCLPNLFEMAAVAVAAHWLLGFSFIDGAVLGTILAAVSLAVVVPMTLDYIDRGRGALKGIPTFLLAACSLDNVFMIVLFTVFLAMHGAAQVNLWSSLAEIPISIALGILSGVVPGVVLYRLFRDYDWRSPKRTLALLGTSILLTWLESALKSVVTFSSLLGIMTMAFIILEKAEPIAYVISQRLKKLWVFAELLLFVLVGAQVNIHVIWQAGLAGMAVILCGLLSRSLGVSLALLGSGLDWREKLFCVVSWLPKATVQAAIGAVPLAAGVASGEEILAVAVLSILVTAPVGAIIMEALGERVLDQGEPSPYRFKELRLKLGLPHVGARVRSKRFGTVWKVIEERETWIEKPRLPGNIQESPALLPAISIRYWRQDTSTGPATGRTMSYRYSQFDPSFGDHWEIVYDW